MHDTLDENTVDRAIPQALHAQISGEIRARITSGTWPAHYRLKSEPELADELGVSRGTLRRALATLIREGLLRQIRGRGTFVTSPLIEPAIAQRMSSLFEDMHEQGVEAATAVIRQELASPPAPIGALLDVAATAQVLRLERIRSTATGPVALLHNYVRADLAPGVEHVDFTAEGLFGALETRYRLELDSARRTFSAEAADTAVATALDVPVGHPVQYLQQVSYLADGTPIEYSDVWINSARLRVTSVLTRR